jgi:hypothetical protein
MSSDLYRTAISPAAVATTEPAQGSSSDSRPAALPVAPKSQREATPKVSLRSRQRSMNSELKG